MIDSPLTPDDQMPDPTALTGPQDIAVDGESLEPQPDAEGNITIDLDPQLPENPQDAPAFNDNLALFMDEGTLLSLGMDLGRMYEEDKRSRGDWEKTYTDGLEYLGTSYKVNTEPWAGACGVTDPLITEALVRFQSNAIMEIFPSEAGPVKTKIIGDITKDKEEQSGRVLEYMNWTLTEQLPGYRIGKEKLLFGFGFSGAGFVKCYYDGVRRRPAAEYVPAEHFIMPYGATDLESAPRYTQYMAIPRNELRKLQVYGGPKDEGLYRDIDLGEPTQVIDEVQNKLDKLTREINLLTQPDTYELLEMHVDCDLPGFEDTKTIIDPDTGEPVVVQSGVALPYIITFEQHTNRILSIYRNWDADDDRRTKLLHFAQYNFIPGPGAYGYGLIHLIGSLSRGSTFILRQLIDAGTLANLPAGYKSDSARVKHDDTPLRPGEWRTANVVQGKLADAFFPLPYKEPSPTLLQLRGELVEMGRRLGSTADLDVGDMSGQAPVGTTLALLERNLKIMSAVQARIHSSLHDEFKILKRVIKENLPDEYPYDVHGASRKIKKLDFDGIDVVPVSNPNSATMAERILQFQAVTQLMGQFPQGFDIPEALRMFVQVLGIKGGEKLVPDKDDVALMDPVSENQSIITGKPVKVFAEQNHQAHIKTHMAFKQDPMIAASMGQNPQAQVLAAALDAHITEHIGFAYRDEIQKKLGVPLPAMGQPMPPDVEASLSAAVSMAAQDLLTEDQQKQAQQQAQQQAQDPVLQLQKQELAIKAQGVQQKAQSDQARIASEAQKEQARQETERMRITSQHQTALSAQQQKAQVDAVQLQIEVEKLNQARVQQDAEMGKLRAEITQLLTQAHLNMTPQPQTNNGN